MFEMFTVHCTKQNKKLMLYHMDTIADAWQNSALGYRNPNFQMFPPTLNHGSRKELLQSSLADKSYTLSFHNNGF